MRKTYNYYKRDGEHWFEWADGESKHVTKCSFHGCIQLGEEFDKFGYDLDSSCEFKWFRYDWYVVSVPWLYLPKPNKHHEQ